MRNVLVPAALALVLASSGFAMAATAAPQSITSTVKAFNGSTHLLTLANGIEYSLPATFKDPGIKVGERVTVKWEMNGKTFQADSVVVD
jgi:uncharacterized protein DUF1344